MYFLFFESLCTHTYLCKYNEHMPTNFCKKKKNSWPIARHANVLFLSFIYLFYFNSYNVFLFLKQLMKFKSLESYSNLLKILFFLLFMSINFCLCKSLLHIFIIQFLFFNFEEKKKFPSFFFFYLFPTFINSL